MMYYIEQFVRNSIIGAHQYDTGNVNRDIKDKYIYDKRVLEYILFKALQIDLDTIIETTESNQTIYEIALDNDSILDFFERANSIINPNRN
ncbi:hypothetical protein A4W76_00380 [Latilactobacillus curvatus]|uniref:hypothetical protein n=1 Tax=Latilactobacillus curvatus TaxID=28038 RepID=UPI0020A39CE1|nr:hypothetical protein [Latilactobacillus curvatus]UTB71286.1 hypothetical protein A4W71_09745 [Latilactobacillus curvatus]UTB73095.1 hypothetical protein A4W72_10115 [Latilactobacillus curvatus]UTB73418.1 hypothetical protein A4W73_00380 [Latilactobacillus curvatus]UTC11393.1 hypothetical protein A4W79_09540 [Latilactobacillus curvatus]UTC13535.1 hypothetical protein A4W80_00415 [Latilactobacillus curvatus]